MIQNNMQKRTHQLVRIPVLWTFICVTRTSSSGIVQKHKDTTRKFRRPPINWRYLLASCGEWRSATSKGPRFNRYPRIQFSHGNIHKNLYIARIGLNSFNRIITELIISIIYTLNGMVFYKVLQWWPDFADQNRSRQIKVCLIQHWHFINISSIYVFWLHIQIT